MGKRLDDGKGGKQQVTLDAALGSILTQDEYRKAANVILIAVEVASEDKVKLQQLRSALLRLLGSRYDAPLPLWWTSTALEKSMWLNRENKDQLEFGSSILDLASKSFESLKSLTAVNASGQTTLAALAPVAGQLCDVASLLSIVVGSLDEESKGNSETVDVRGKQVRMLVRRLKELIEELLGFTVLCRSKDSESFKPFLFLTPAPTVFFENFADYLYPPFPLASEKMRKPLSRDLANKAIIAEIVSVEVMVLQLVVESIERRIALKKQSTEFSVGRDEFAQRLKLLAVHSVWGTSSPSHSETLLNLLLEKELPVLDFLDAKEETLLRGVLYEVVLIDPPFSSLVASKSGMSDSSSSGLDHSSVIFMKKIAVARRARKFFKSQEERSRLASLLKNIATWLVPPNLFKWFKTLKKHQLPVVALQDHEALTNFLVNTAEKLVFKAILDKTLATWSSGLPSGTAKGAVELEVENGNADSDRVGEDLFFVDTAGEKEAAIDSQSAADMELAAAAKTIEAACEDMKKKQEKKKKRQSKVLFHRHEQLSPAIKRPRTEMDDVDMANSSGADSEDSEGNQFKSAKRRMNKSKDETLHVQATSDEDEDEDKDDDDDDDDDDVVVNHDNDNALLSSQSPSAVENSDPEALGNVSEQEQQDTQVPQKTEEDESANEVQGFEEVVDGGGAEEAPEASSEGNVDNLRESGDLTPELQKANSTNGQEEIVVVKSSKTKRVKEKSRQGGANDHLEIFEEIKQDLVTASAKLSSADVIDALQVDQPGSSKVVGVPEVEEERVQAKAEGPDVLNVKDGGQGTSPGSQLKKSRDEPSTPYSRKKRSKGERDIVGVPAVEEERVEAKDEASPGSQLKKSRDETSSPKSRKKTESSEALTTGRTRTRSGDKGTSPGSELKESRDETSTPTSRKKRSKGGRDITGVPVVEEERVEEEVSDVLNALSEDVKTPDAKVQGSDAPVTSVKPSTRKRKVKPDPVIVSGDLTGERLSPRKTRSGRSLGTPPATPTTGGKSKMRRKLMLEPLEEEK